MHGLSNTIPGLARGVGDTLGSEEGPDEGGVSIGRSKGGGI